MRPNLFRISRSSNRSLTQHTQRSRRQGRPSDNRQFYTAGPLLLLQALPLLVQLLLVQRLLT
jgi:hypothetical protein